MRREFDLSEEDFEYLTSLAKKGQTWEAILKGQEMWVVVSDWPAPEGYNIQSVSVAIMLPQNYPSSEIDMAFFNPFIERKDGVGIKATDSRMNLDGKEWQRWSRHRTGDNPWRLGVDNILTHLTQVNHWLVREFVK